MTLSRRKLLQAVVAVPALLRVDPRDPRPFDPRAAAGQPRASTLDFAFASASDMVRAIQRREISVLDLTQLMFKRIDALNPKVNAIVTQMRDEAIARAREADAALAKGRSLGPLHGIPVTIKDAFEVKGVRTTAGNPAFKDYLPASDAAVVERFRRAGAILLGMTNVPFMVSDWQTSNEIFGRTNNPWDLTRTPGGSTGGGAAALAAGFGCLSSGSDIAGSIRIPAHFCGVYGHKPTLNLVPDRGHIPPFRGRVTRTETVPSRPEAAGYLAAVGPLARSAADLRLAMEVLGGPDRDEAVAYTWKLPAPRKSLVRDYRIGYMFDDKMCPLSAEVRGLLVEAIATLRKAGATVEEGWPTGVGVEQELRNYQVLLGASTGSAITYPDFVEARSRQAQARAAWQDYFRTHDAFLMPVGFIPAFPHMLTGPRILKTPEGERPYGDLLFWISFATHTGLPATVAPVGLTSGGLPVGIQILGPYLEDATTIDIAARLEQLRGGFRPPPGF